MTIRTLKATCSIALPADPPEWVHLMPIGAVEARDGRKWTLKDPQAVVAASLARKLDLVVDYEHQTDLAEQNGQPAPAAGWITAVEARPDGIWGRVEWTTMGAERIRNREYRYLSPTFLSSKKTGEVTAILRAALTNNPALDLVALATEQDDDSMEELLKALAAALGLPETTDQDTVLAKVGELVETAKSADETVAQLRKTFDLDDKATPEDIATAMSEEIAKAKAEANEVDPKAFVPRAEFDRVVDRLDRQEKQTATDKATDAVDKAMRDGKIAPASKDWALSYASKDPDGFTAFCKEAPVIVTPEGGAPKTPKAGDALTQEEKDTCRVLGLAEDEFRKTRDEEVAR